MRRTVLAPAFTVLLAADVAAASSSSPIAVTPDDRQVWVVNPDDGSVSVIDVQGDANRKVAEIDVGREPTNLAIHPRERKVFVSNTVDGTVSVIDASRLSVTRTIRVCAEPRGIATTPNGSKAYVSCATDRAIAVIDATRDRLARIVRDVGTSPRALAVTNDGDGDDRDEKVYVASFFAETVPGAVVGADDYKQGGVTVLSTANDRVIDEVALAPLADAGFRSNGSALQRIPATDPPTFTVVTGAFPNALAGVAIKGNRAYVPSTAASPDGPVRFNVNVQAFLSVIDVVNDVEGTAGGVVQTINMNRGINFEPAGPDKLFLGVPSHVAFERASNEGWVVASASNILVKVVLDANGTPTIDAPEQAGDPGGVVRIRTGQNPRGVAISSTDTRAYVMNYVSRDVTVVDLQSEQAIATVPAGELPPAGTIDATVQVGKAIFFSSAGVDLPQYGALGSIATGRLSSEGWSGCVSCHFDGLTDNVVWIFGAGPRKSLPLNGTFNPDDPNDQKVLNYSAIFDEVQDFENNIRNVSGGLGLITLEDGVTPDPVLNAFDPASAGRSEALDALKEFVARGIRTPISPASVAPAGATVLPIGTPGGSLPNVASVARGRRLFEVAGCPACHGGAGWSSSRRDYTPPPATSEIVRGQVIRFLTPVGTFDPTADNEIRQNGQPPLGADGFNAPSLLGIFDFGPYLHDGSAPTLGDVLDNRTHRAAGSDGVDTLADPVDRAALVAFLKSIDASTTPFPE